MSSSVMLRWHSWEKWKKGQESAEKWNEVLAFSDGVLALGLDSLSVDSRWAMS